MSSEGGGGMTALMRRVRHGGGDSGVAMLLALMVIAIVTTVSLGVAGVTLAQVKPSQVEKKYTRTVHAAEAGLDAALNRIRAAKNSAGEGDKSKLPCGPLAGSVSPNQGALTYNVRIRYYTDDPSGQTDSWRNGRAMACGASGTAVVPAYALLESTGAGYRRAAHRCR